MTGLTNDDREGLEDAAYCVLAERNDAWPVGGDAYAIANSAVVARAVEAIVARAVNEALTEAADEIERVADEAMSATSRSFHPAGTHSDGRRDGCWEGRIDAARIVRARTTN